MNTEQRMLNDEVFGVGLASLFQEEMVEYPMFNVEWGSFGVRWVGGNGSGGAMVVFIRFKMRVLNIEHRTPNFE